MTRSESQDLTDEKIDWDSRGERPVWSAHAPIVNGKATITLEPKETFAEPDDYANEYFDTNKRYIVNQLKKDFKYGKS